MIINGLRTVAMPHWLTSRTPLVQATRQLRQPANAVGIAALLVAFVAALGFFVIQMAWPRGPVFAPRLSAFGIARLDELCFAMDAEDQPRVQRLLNRLRHSDLHAVDAEGRTLLQRAALSRQTEVCRRLVGLGADVHANDRRGMGVLWYAIFSGDPAMTELLVSAGADVHWRHSPSGIGAVSAAAMIHSPGVLQAVLSAGADPNTADADGRTPLMVAVEGTGRAKAEMVFLLLSAGVDVNAADASGDTPLICAARFGSAETVRLLLEAGADPHHVNAAGETALDAARVGYDDEIFPLLLSAERVDRRPLAMH